MRLAAQWLRADAVKAKRSKSAEVTVAEVVAKGRDDAKLEWSAHITHLAPVAAKLQQTVSRAEVVYMVWWLYNPLMSRGMIT